MALKIGLITLFFSSSLWAQHALVFQTDFGLQEGAVASMKGVAFGVSPELNMFDVTHEIPRFNIWEAAYRLNQVADYWPKGTVFVNVVDPGVGTTRKSVVLKTKSGHFFVSPDNGSLSLVSESLGIDEVREINEKTNRLEGSERSHTFHGRDVYAYTGARLASEVIAFEQVGDLLTPSVMQLDYAKPELINKRIIGSVPILDAHYGNVWTNINVDLFDRLDINIGDEVWVKITNNAHELFFQKVKFVSSFGGVEIGEPAIYINDILNIGIAINQGDMAKEYKIKPGPNVTFLIWK
ncbi:MAG: S-adenosylmethionine hydrolase [Woeseiaceae bacterium]|jgi:S-adenosylmethionine hydrolase|tara:strand:+ start:172 stop:1056 length:885 start_codon:yes stop_codon:yes gene_type:complete